MFMINPFLSAMCQAWPPSSNAASAAAFHITHVPNGIASLSPAKSRNDRLHHAAIADVTQICFIVIYVSFLIFFLIKAPCVLADSGVSVT